MMFRRERRGVPELNMTSTADISFMLLIFFLVTTSMDVDKGLSRQLPPVNQTETQQPAHIREGLMLRLHISSNNSLTCDDEPINFKTLKNRVKTHVKQKGAEHIIQLEADRKSSYETYFKVQNAIVAAYQELRDERAQIKYGHAYSLCSDDEQAHLREDIPQRISEVYLAQEKGGQP